MSTTTALTKGHLSLTDNHDLFAMPLFEGDAARAHERVESGPTFAAVVTDDDGNEAHGTAIISEGGTVWFTRAEDPAPLSPTPAPLTRDLLDKTIRSYRSARTSVGDRARIVAWWKHHAITDVWGALLRLDDLASLER